MNKVLEISALKAYQVQFPTLGSDSEMLLKELAIRWGYYVRLKHCTIFQSYVLEDVQKANNIVTMINASSGIIDENNYLPETYHAIPIALAARAGHRVIAERMIFLSTSTDKDDLTQLMIRILVAYGHLKTINDIPHIEFSESNYEAIAYSAGMGGNIGIIDELYERKENRVRFSILGACYNGKFELMESLLIREDVPVEFLVNAKKYGPYSHRSLNHLVPTTRSDTDNTTWRMTQVILFFAVFFIFLARM